MSKKISHKNLISSLIEEHDELSDVFNTFSKQFKKEFIKILLKEREIEIDGVGKFVVVVSKERKSTDVNTGEEIVIKSRKKIGFLPDNDLRNTINSPLAHLEPINIDEETSEFSPLNSLSKQADEIKDILINIQSTGVDHGVSQMPDEQEKIVENIAENTSTYLNGLSTEPVESVEIEENSEPKAELTTKNESDHKEHIDVPLNQRVESDNTTPEIIEQQPIHIDRKSRWQRNRWLLLLTCVVVVAAILILLFTKKTDNTIAQREEPIQTTINTNDTILDNSIVIDTVGVFEKPRSYAELIDSVWLKKGTTLVKLSEKYYGHKQFWVYIYEANKATIANPNNMEVNTLIYIPLLDSKLTNASDSLAIAHAKTIENSILYN